ncbi:MAG: hypothetical protein GX216_03915 [Methanomicrobiales archaeon]|nr:hypothetical protein [Methanomicrobiales archaeon]
MRRVLVVFLAILLVPVSSAIYVEVPDYWSGIASAGVQDVINGRYGDVIFATDSGISVYTANGTWYSVNARHPGETAYGWVSPGCDMVSALALDSTGRLWIGYPNGLQFQTRAGYESIQDQHLLKNLGINCLARWGDEIWIATGRAGLHRYHDGNWTWFKPGGQENPGCYTIKSMVVDAASDTLVIGSERDGVWMLQDRAGEIRFEPVVYAEDRDFDAPSGVAVDAAGDTVVAEGEPVRRISEVRADPFGGVYLFNNTVVLRYVPGAGAIPVVHARDLSAFPVIINDIAATPDGVLLIASDNGIYGWEGSRVVMHVTSGDGIRSNAVKRLFVDAYGRCWFVVPGNVGYLPAATGLASLDLKPAGTPDVPATVSTIAPPVAPVTESPALEEGGGVIERVWAVLMEWIGKVSGGRIGRVS